MSANRERPNPPVTSSSTSDQKQGSGSPDPTTKFQARSEQAPTEEAKRSIEEIAFSLLRLDILLYQTAHAAVEGQDTLFFGPEDLEAIARGRSPDALSYQGYVSQDRKIRGNISHLSLQENLEGIGNDWCIHDYARPFLDQCLENLRRARLSDLRQTEIFLDRVYRIIRELKSWLTVALENGYLAPAEDIYQLMLQLQERFPELCRKLGKEEVPLVSLRERWWLPPLPARRSSRAHSGPPVPESSRASGSQRSPRTSHIPRSPGSGGGGGGGGIGTSYQMPSHSSAAAINGAQLNSSVFTGAVYFGNVEQRSAPDQVHESESRVGPTPPSSGYQNTANFSGANNQGTQIGQQFNFRDAPAPPGSGGWN